MGRQVWLPGALLVAALSGACAPASAQVESYCQDALQYVSEHRGMIGIIEPDTLSDWRTGLEVPGCRVTAAGITTIGIRGEAERFYQEIRGAGWERTPDPRDAPNEASLRFRKEGHDCLFNVYEGMLLFTDAEIKVGMEFSTEPGEERYGVFVMCMPAMEARPRPPEP